jgi:hypothetical protein
MAYECPNRVRGLVRGRIGPIRTPDPQHVFSQHFPIRALADRRRAATNVGLLTDELRGHARVAPAPLSGACRNHKCLPLRSVHCTLSIQAPTFRLGESSVDDRGRGLTTTPRSGCRAARSASAGRCGRGRRSDSRFPGIDRRWRAGRSDPSDCLSDTRLCRSSSR